MTIFDKSRMLCKTFIQQLNALFLMGKELEGIVEAKIENDVTITDLDTYYLLSVGSTSTATLKDNNTYYTLTV